MKGEKFRFQNDYPCDGLVQRFELSRWVWLWLVLLGWCCRRVLGQLFVCENLGFEEKFLFLG